MVSNAEKQFRAEYPNARHTSTPDRFGPFYRVYAGDYLCAESYSLANAYKDALDWAHDGLITPDPDEVSRAL